MKEIWRTTKISKYYKISNLGRAMSIDRVISYLKQGKVRKLNVKGKILKQKINDKGYCSIQIQDAENKIHKVVLIHRLVAEAFIANPNNEPLVLHLDDNPRNNRYDNLMWGDQQENMRQASERNRIPDNSGRFKKGHKPNRTSFKKGHISKPIFPVGYKAYNVKKLECSNGLIFDSSYRAADWINKTLYNNTHKITSISQNIRACANGRRKTAYTFTWNFI
jgi:hypothetical protein